MVIRNAQPHDRVREEEVFCRERTPTEEKVLGAFLYQSGMSYQKVEHFVSGSYEAVRQWYHTPSEFFEPRVVERRVVAVDETKMKDDGKEVYVWAAVDVNTVLVLTRFLRTVMNCSVESLDVAEMRQF